MGAVDNLVPCLSLSSLLKPGLGVFPACFFGLRVTDVVELIEEAGWLVDEVPTAGMLGTALLICLLLKD